MYFVTSDHCITIQLIGFLALMSVTADHVFTSVSATDQENYDTDLVSEISGEIQPHFYHHKNTISDFLLTVLPQSSVGGVKLFLSCVNLQVDDTIIDSRHVARN